LRTPLFVRPFNHDQQRDSGHYLPFAFPGLDLFALGFSVIDRWAAAGHPMDGTGQLPERREQFDFIVCPLSRDEHGERSGLPRCGQDFYRFALDNEVRQTRLVEALLARHDPILTEMTFENLIRLGGEAVGDMLSVFRGLEANASLWSVA